MTHPTHVQASYNPFPGSSQQDFKAVENLNPASIAMDILSHHDSDNDGAITAEEFQVWAVKNSLPDDFYKLLFQVRKEDL